MEKKFNVREASERVLEIKNRLNQMAENLESEKSREDYTEAEKVEQKELYREMAILNGKIAAVKDNNFTYETKNNGEILRETLKDVRKDMQKREISLSVLKDAQQHDKANNITTAGAINMTINDVMPDLEKGLPWGLVGMKVQTGVHGNILWPYSTSSVEVEELGETVALNDKDIDFNKIQAVPYRSGITIAVTNEAIDDASFDLMGYVQAQITLAVQRYLNKKTFSHANFTGMKGPWAGKAKSTALVANYKAIKAAKAAIAASGVDMNGFCYVLSAAGKALLEATPKADGQCGFICENGKIDGDPVFVTEYVNTKADGTQETTKQYIGMGNFAYLAANQHGDVRMVVDPFTLAGKNMTKITLNTHWSLTVLREQAFAMYELTEAQA